MSFYYIHNLKMFKFYQKSTKLLCSVLIPHLKALARQKQIINRKYNFFRTFNFLKVMIFYLVNKLNQRWANAEDQTFPLFGLSWHVPNKWRLGFERICTKPRLGTRQLSPPPPAATAITRKANKRNLVFLRFCSFTSVHILFPFIFPKNTFF